MISWFWNIGLNADHRSGQNYSDWWCMTWIVANGFELRQVRQLPVEVESCDQEIWTTNKIWLIYAYSVLSTSNELHSHQLWAAWRKRGDPLERLVREKTVPNTIANPWQIWHVLGVSVFILPPKRPLGNFNNFYVLLAAWYRACSNHFKIDSYIWISSLVWSSFIFMYMNNNIIINCDVEW